MSKNLQLLGEIVNKQLMEIWGISLTIHFLFSSQGSEMILYLLYIFDL